MTEWDFIQHDEIDSTSTEAFRILESSAYLGRIIGNSIIYAKRQISGRGRNGNSWLEGGGNLYFSLIVNSKISTENFWQFSFLSAICVDFALSKLSKQSFNRMNVKYKWPNDILINGKKFCGILIEKKSNISQIVIGIGINVTTSPKNTKFSATSLIEEGFAWQSDSEKQFFEIFLNEFDDLYLKLHDFGFDFIKNLWLKKAYKIGEMVKIDGADRKFEALGNNGELIVRNENGLEYIKSLDFLE